MMKKYIILFIAGIMSISSYGFDSTFDNANKSYQEEKYQDALEQYEELINLDYHSYELYYNLGNTHYRLGDFVNAVWYYEKAKKLNPSDEDLLANITLVNQRFVDDIESLPTIPLSEWWSNFIYANPAWSFISLFFVLASILYASSFWLKGKLMISSRYLSLTFALIGLFGLIANKSYHNHREMADEAILFDKNVKVVSEPSNNSIELFSLHQGTKVQVQEQKNGWAKIKIKNGEVGWMNDKGLKMIN